MTPAPPGFSESPADGPSLSRRVSRVAVIGAGAMGRGIAACTVGIGLDTSLYDTSAEVLERAVEKIAARSGADAGTVTVADSLERAVDTADLVVESVPEILETKAAVLAAAEDSAPGHAIFATNTSHLSITAIAASVGRSDHVIGLHFFNPPPSMGLVEVIPALQTAPWVVTWAVQFVQDLGKQATISRDSPGFLSTRGHVAHFLECVRMVQDGVGTVEDIDATCRLGLRHPMGALELGDYIGLDVLLHVAEGMHAAFGDRFLPPQLLRQMVAAGHYGKKSGRGFYQYADSAEGVRR